MRNSLFFKIWLGFMIMIAVIVVLQIVGAAYVAITYGPRALEAGVSALENIATMTEQK